MKQSNRPADKTAGKKQTKEFERVSSDEGKTSVFDTAKKKKTSKRRERADGALNGETVPIRTVYVSDAVRREEDEKQAVSLKDFVQRISLRWKTDGELQQNEYYIASARKIRLFKFAVIAILILFIFGVITVRHADLTAENFRYFLRDFDFGQTKYTGEYSTVRYDRQTGTEFAMYKGDLVLVRAGETSVFSSSGNMILNDQNHFVSPRVISSEKYFLVFDPGDTSRSYSLYNAFSCLHTKECEAQIIDASISKNGVYCIVTAGETYKGIIEIYNSDFKLLNTISKDKYIWDVVLADDGSRLMILSSYSENGMWRSEIDVLDPYNEEPLFHSVIENTTVLSGVFSEDASSFRILTDRGLMYFKNGSAQGKEIEFDGRIPVCFTLSPKLSAVAFNKNVLGNDLELLVSDEEGGGLASFRVTEDIIRTESVGDCIYVLTDESLYVMNCAESGMKKIPLPDKPEAFLQISDDLFYLCFGNRAEVLTGSGEFYENTKTN